MEKRLRVEKALFTLFIGLVLAFAIYTAREWPLRASIIILVLGSVGLVLSLVQLIVDLWGDRLASREAEGLAFDAPALRPESRWGNLEIWAWILGLYAAIHLVGFQIAALVFVLAYTKIYGANWRLALMLALVAWGFLYSIFERILHVPWPKSLLWSLIGC